MSVTVHEISFRGLAGTIFILLALGVVLFVIGFSTTGWSINGDVHEGLWESCTCGGRLPDEGEYSVCRFILYWLRSHDHFFSVWFHAARAMITIGLIGICASFVLISVYMCIHSISKNSTLTALVVISFISGEPNVIRNAKPSGNNNQTWWTIYPVGQDLFDHLKVVRYLKKNSPDTSSFSPPASPYYHDVITVDYDASLFPFCHLCIILSSPFHGGW